MLKSMLQNHYGICLWYLQKFSTTTSRSASILFNSNLHQLSYTPVISSRFNHRNSSIHTSIISLAAAGDIDLDDDNDNGIDYAMISNKPKKIFKNTSKVSSNAFLNDVEALYWEIRRHTRNNHAPMFDLLPDHFMALYDRVWSNYLETSTRSEVSSTTLNMLTETLDILFQSAKTSSKRREEVPKQFARLRHLIADCHGRQLSVAPIVYETVIRHYCNTRGFMDARDFVNDLRNAGNMLSVKAIVIYNRTLLEHRKYNEFFAFYKTTLRNWPSHRPLVVVNQFLRALIETDHLDLAQKIFIRMANVLPVSSKCSTQTPPVPLWQWPSQETLSENGSPSLPELTLLCDNLFSTGEIINADVTTYGLLIKALTAANHLNTALDLYRDMLSRNITPTIHIYTTLISHMALNGDSDAPLALIREMMNNNLMPDVTIMNCLVNGHVESGNMTSAHNVYMQMKQSDVLQADVYTYATLMKGYARAQNMREAEAVYREMLTSQVTPNAVVYSTLICGYFTQDPTLSGLDKVETVLAEMSTRGVPWDVYTANILLDKYMSLGCVDQATSLFSMMLQNGVLDIRGESTHFVSPKTGQPERWQQDIVSVNTLMIHHARRGDVRQVIALYNDAMHRGLEPDQVTFMALFQALLDNDQWVTAYHIFKLLCKNPVAYNTQINHDDSEMMPVVNEGEFVRPLSHLVLRTICNNLARRWRWILKDASATKSSQVMLMQFTKEIVDETRYVHTLPNKRYNEQTKEHQSATLPLRSLMWFGGMYIEHDNMPALVSLAHYISTNLYQLLSDTSLPIQQNTVSSLNILHFKHDNSDTGITHDISVDTVDDQEHMIKLPSSTLQNNLLKHVNQPGPLTGGRLRFFCSFYATMMNTLTNVTLAQSTLKQLPLAKDVYEQLLPQTKYDPRMCLEYLDHIHGIIVQESDLIRNLVAQDEVQSAVTESVHMNDNMIISTVSDMIPTTIMTCGSPFDIRRCRRFNRLKSRSDLLAWAKEWSESCAAQEVMLPDELDHIRKWIAANRLVVSRKWQEQW